MTCPSNNSTPTHAEPPEPRTPSLAELQDFIDGASHLDFSSDDSEDEEFGEKEEVVKPILFTFKGQQDQAEALAQFVIETEQQCDDAFKMALAPSLVPILVSGLRSTGLDQMADFSKWYAPFLYSDSGSKSIWLLKNLALQADLVDRSEHHSARLGAGPTDDGCVSAYSVLFQKRANVGLISSSRNDAPSPPWT